MTASCVDIKTGEHRRRFEVFMYHVIIFSNKRSYERVATPAQTITQTFQLTLPRNYYFVYSRGILNEVSNDLEELAPKLKNENHPPHKVPSSGTMPDAIYSEGISLPKDTVYGGDFPELSLVDKDDNEILSEEAIFKILGTSSHEGGAKLSKYSRRKRKGDQSRIIPHSNSRHYRIKKVDYSRNNRDVSNNNAVNSVVNSRLHLPPMFLDKRLRPLNKKQRRLLRSNPGITEEIARGVKEALNECKFQFRNRKWRCPIDSSSRNIFGKIMDRGKFN